MALNPDQILQDREDLLILAGKSRPIARPKAAIRVEDFDALIRIDFKAMKARQPISAAPTAAEYNALLGDFLTVLAALSLVSTAIAARKKP